MATYFCRTCGYVIGIEDGAVLKDCPRCHASPRTWTIHRPADRYAFTDADLRDIARLHDWGMQRMKPGDRDDTKA